MHVVTTKTLTVYYILFLYVYTVHMYYTYIDILIYICSSSWLQYLPVVREEMVFICHL